MKSKNYHQLIAICIGIILSISMFLFFHNAYAMTVEYQETKTISLHGTFETEEKWHATTYDLKDAEKLNEYCGKYPENCRDENNLIPAMKICFWNSPARKYQYCKRVVDEIGGDEKGPKYTYEITKELKIVQLCNKCKQQYGLLLHARNTGFTIGHVDGLFIWAYSAKEKSFNKITPSFRFTEQGEYKIIPYLTRGIEGVLIRATPFMDWGNETRYDRHYYIIDIYRLSPKGSYGHVGKYKTIRKYESFDDMNKINVIGPEMKKIRKYLLKTERTKK